MKDWLVLASVTLLTGAGGFMLGKGSSGGPSQVSNSMLQVEGRSLLGSDIPTHAMSAAELAAARRSLAQGVALGYSADDLARDLRMLGRGSSPMERYESLTRLLENLSPENLPQVLRAFKDIPPTTEYLNEYQMLLYAWTKFDRAGAIDFIEDLEAGGLGSGELSLSKEELLKPVLSSWASENPKQALAWFEYLPKEQQTHHLKLSLMSGWASNNPTEAAEYLQTQPANQNREYLAGQLASHMFKQSPQSAAAWAEDIKDQKFKEQIFEELAEDWVSVDPKGLASWLEGHIHQQYAWEAVEDLGRGWVASDSTAATEWFENLPDGPAKQKGIHKMAQSWAENDLASMGEWLNTLPDSTTTDRGVQAYSERLAEQAPESALESAMGIMNDDMRNETVHELAQDWYSRDQEAALSWAEANDYPPEAMERTLDIYAKMNAQQLQQINKMINRDQVSPDRMRELRATQAMLQEQAAQFEEMIPKVERTNNG